ncbi:MAG: nucleoside triphosphate pyrophosphohydrolase [Deltaproteobacteria bacterium]|nr:MAG: nucleoside triphosphate pyrophosphohydrolase [Deltaproteobacteria bacterium]
MLSLVKRHLIARWNRTKLRFPIPSWSTLLTLYRYAQLIQVVRILRSRNGCPWDRKQTLEEFLPYLKEEAAEVYAAVKELEEGNADPFAHEMGDLLFVMTFIMVLCDEADLFSLSYPGQTLVEKMVRRHPHVFDVASKNLDAIREQWQRIKAEERQDKPAPATVFAKLKPSLSALSEAQNIGKLVAKLGFDWPHLDQVWDKVVEEVEELRQELSAHLSSNSNGVHDAGVQDRQQQELGDLLFALTNLARHLAIDAEQALRDASAKFRRRFRYIEKQLSKRNQTFQDTSLDEMEAIWQDAKVHLQDT